MRDENDEARSNRLDKLLEMVYHYPVCGIVAGWPEFATVHSCRTSMSLSRVPAYSVNGFHECFSMDPNETCDVRVQKLSGDEVQT